MSNTLACTAYSSNHSDDRVTVYSGRPTPLMMCGYHATYHARQVYAGLAVAGRG